MYLPPKQLAFRLLIWSGLLIWAVFYLNRDGAQESMAPDVRALAPPPDRAVPTTLAPPIVDPELLLGTMKEASAVAARCGGTGATLSFRVGALGLTEATLGGRVTDAVAECLRAGIWALDWPRGAQDLESSMVL